MNKSALIFYLIFQVAIHDSFCDTIFVPKDYESIGEALKQSKEGDVVLV